ncbi:unnamed protein product [Litomosoides sigmodontis]|uniref:Uncharacterized protein n=1 Tax=Litomosoides sigmodontis TaxID=42156 RepID=A0A3P7M6U5_LITSI|nr:unnamed protein product [Litomosoides sigmodontis]
MIILTINSSATEVVRNSFLKVIGQKSESDVVRYDDLSVGYHLTAGDSQRLKSIEQALREQRQLLETIASQSHQHRSPLFNTETWQTEVATLRKCFLTATPQLIVRLSNILLELAKGQVTNDLDSVLQDLLQSTCEGCPTNETDEH